MPVPHSDNHDLWISPLDNNRMVKANDGGANVSFNAGRTWTEQDQATAQFYHVTTTNHFPYRVCGAQQDNSTVCGPSRAPGGISIGQWYDVGGGESGYIAVHPDDPDIVYAGSYGGLLTRFDRRTGFERNINPWPDNPMGHDAADAKYRFQWTFPIVISPHDPKTMYVGSSVVFKTTNEGQSFEPISPDLTRHDPRRSARQVGRSRRIRRRSSTTRPFSRSRNRQSLRESSGRDRMTGSFTSPATMGRHGRT